MLHVLAIALIAASALASDDYAPSIVVKSGSTDCGSLKCPECDCGGRGGGRHRPCDDKHPHDLCDKVDDCRAGEFDRQRYRLVGNANPPQIRLVPSGNTCDLVTEPAAFNEITFAGARLDRFNVGDCAGTTVSDGALTGQLTLNGFQFGPGDPVDEVVTFTRQGRRVTLEFGPGRQVNETGFNNVPTWFQMGPNAALFSNVMSFRNTSAERFFGLPGPAIFTRLPIVVFFSDMYEVDVPNMGVFGFFAINARNIHGELQIDCGNEGFAPFISIRLFDPDGLNLFSQPYYPGQPYNSIVDPDLAAADIFARFGFELPEGSVARYKGGQFRLNSKYVTWTLPDDLEPEAVAPEAFPSGAAAAAFGSARTQAVVSKAEMIADLSAPRKPQPRTAFFAKHL